MYGGLDACERLRMRRLENDNRRLKLLVAELSLNMVVLKDVAASVITSVS